MDPFHQGVKKFVAKFL